MKGWIKLHRQILENSMYFSEPFDRTHAWIDLLLLANSSKSEFWSKGQIVNLEPGQFVTSIKTLSQRWCWSRDKVNRYLNHLNRLGMCTTNRTQLGTTITIVKWGLYQDTRTSNKSSDESSDNTSDKSSDESSDETLTRNKEYKNIRRGESQPVLSPEEFEAWKKEMMERMKI